MSSEYLPIGRREVVKILLTGAASPLLSTSIAFRAFATSCHDAVRLPASKQKFEPKIFTAEQYKIIVTLTELIIPSKPKDPGAREAKVAEFFDAVLLNAEKEDQKIFLKGLSWLDDHSIQVNKKKFSRSSKQQQVILLAGLSKNEESPESRGEEFFATVKRITVLGFVTSEVGQPYLRPRVMGVYQGCIHPEHKA